MTSAPLRAAETAAAKPNIKTHGHLALVEWEDTLPSATSPAAPSFRHPTRRTVLDRFYEGGTVILFFATIAALAVSLCRF